MVRFLDLIVLFYGKISMYIIGKTREYYFKKFDLDNMKIENHAHLLLADLL